MSAIKFTVLDNTDLRITIDNRNDFLDILSRRYCDERHYLSDMMDDSGYTGNDWDCLYNIGLTEAPAVGQGAIYPKEGKENDGYPIDYKNCWYFENYMLHDYIEILQKTAENLINTRQQLRNVFTGQQNQANKVQKLDVKSPDEKLMERIMKVINDNISNPNLTIEIITTNVGISRVHLHRKLKELTNQTTRDFIRNIRLKQAAQLLSEKRHTISEIAMLTGFGDPNSFSTAFKELYGIPPLMYMKTRLEKKEE